MRLMPGFLILFFVIVSFYSLVFGQFENGWKCGMEEEQAATMKSSEHHLNFIDPLPTYDGINFKVTVLYFRDADDTFDAPVPPYDPDTHCRVNSWPITSDGPNWIGELLIPTPFNATTVDADTAARPYSITTYFYQMSDGNIWVYGDEYAYPHTTVLNIPANENEWQNHNQIVHEWLIDNHDLTDLDNDGDDVVDMIIFLNRSGYAPGYQGIAEGAYLPSPVDITGAAGEPEIWGREIVNWVRNSGVYARNIYDLLDVYVVFHEIGHQLRQARGHLNGLHRWNLMSGVGLNPPTHSGQVMSAWERMELGWLTFTDITDDQLNYTLSDVTSSAEAVRIPVGANDYFMLELRQSRERFEIRENCGVSTDLPDGLLISYSVNNNQPIIRPADNDVALIAGTYRNGDESDLFPNGGITEITPYTTPNTDDAAGNPTQIAITNLHYDGDDIVFDVHQNYWEGNITVNTTWSTEAFVGADVTVNSGVTLTINAGTTIRFASGARLTVNGAIQANGSAANPITFTSAESSPAAGDWNGIWVQNSSASSSFDYCTVEYSSNSIRVESTSGQVTVDYSTFENNTLGFIAQYSSPLTVSNSTFQNNTYGLWLKSSAASGTIEVSDNIVTGNSSHGIYFISGVGKLGQNDITENGGNGIYCISNSTPTIRSVFISDNFGFNKITGNSGDGVKTTGNSFPSLGINYQNATKDYYGYNDIYDNDGYDVNNSNTSSDSIKAERNHWSAQHDGSSPDPSEINHPVDFSPPIPQPSLMVKFSPNQLTASETISFAEAFDLEVKGQYQAAADLYFKLLTEEPDAENVGYGVTGLIRCYFSMERRDEITKVLDDLIAAVPGTAAEWSAKDHSLPYLVQQAQYDIALTRAAQLLQQKKTDPFYESLYLFELAAINQIKSGGNPGMNLSAAQARYQELVQKYPASELAFFAELELQNLGGASAGKLALDNNPELNTREPEYFILHQNYPNPFNPETTIRYQIRAGGRVRLNIFNLRGQKIRTLIDELRTPGLYAKSWDGRDDYGHSVASGIYLIQIEAGGTIEARKVTLLR